MKIGSRVREKLYPSFCGTIADISINKLNGRQMIFVHWFGGQKAVYHCDELILADELEEQHRVFSLKMSDRLR